jgi:hypothetical protein
MSPAADKGRFAGRPATAGKLAGRAAAVAGVAILLGASCQPKKTGPAPPPEAPPAQPVPEKTIGQSEFYRVRGKVVDGETQHPIAQARLSLRVVVLTPGGPRYARAYGLASADGSYQLELPIPVDMMRQAREIEVSAGMPGYEPAVAAVPPPDRPREFYVAPTVALKRRPATPFSGPSTPGGPTPPRPMSPQPRGPGSPLPWK